MSFWPNDIFAGELLPPHAIMKRAGEELRTLSRSVLSVSIRETRLPDRVVLSFIVKNDAYKLEHNLFEATYQPGRTYPIAIEPPATDIPEFLIRKRFIPGTSGFPFSSMSLTILGASPGKTIENEWVCATPQEFLEKLKTVLALDHVKSIIISLLAPAQFLPAEDMDEPPQELSDRSESQLLGEEDELSGS